MWRQKDNWIGVLVNYKLRSNYKTIRLIYRQRWITTEFGTKEEVKGNGLV